MQHCMRAVRTSCLHGPGAQGRTGQHTKCTRPSALAWSAGACGRARTALPAARPPAPGRAEPGTPSQCQGIGMSQQCWPLGCSAPRPTRQRCPGAWPSLRPRAAACCCCSGGAAALPCGGQIKRPCGRRREACTARLRARRKVEGSPWWQNAMPWRTWPAAPGGAP